MIEAKQLTKRFDTLAALDQVDFTIRPGTVYGLVGSNGSGKSTFLRLIAGIYYPDGGEILVDGQRPFDNLSVKSRVFFLPDSPYFVHQSNVDEMADFYSLFYGRFNRERYAYLCSVFPIDTKMRISRMSKGMQRQAALMLALSCMPDILLLDEAFDGLDPIIRQVLKRLLADSIAQYGLTVIIASHNLRELEDLCDHIGLLHKGKIIFNSELDMLKSGLHKVQAAFHLVPPPDRLQGLDILKIQQQGAMLHMVIRGDAEEIRQRLNVLEPIFVEMMAPTLEEIFIYELEVTGYDIRSILS